MSRIHLVDASPYIFRAYFSLPDSIRDPGGRSVHAVYGFATFLLKLVEDEAATHLAAAFDESLTSSFRNEIYPAYKSGRELPPDDLKAQLDDCRRLAAALGVPTFRSARYEAEDLLAALMPPLLEDGHDVVLVSSDKDLLQLVDARVSMLDFARDTRFTPADVEEKFGVRPEQITDYLGLAGDSVDDIPGVPGVGKKTAAALLAAFDRLEDALDDLDAVAALEVRGARSLAKKLAEHRERALLSKRLATLAVEEARAEASASLDDLALGGGDSAALEERIEALGFGRLAERLRTFGA
ncbi:MAG: 5'-3' exonuclease H3TH domain-containing protein [Acidobacteriota bacterium]